MPLAYQQPFREEIKSLLALGIIEPSTSPWSSSPMPVKKHEGGIRIVVHFRKLNLVTVPEPFLKPSIDSILAQLGDATFLSKLDLLKGFHQVSLDEGKEERVWSKDDCCCGVRSIEVGFLGEVLK